MSYEINENQNINSENINNNNDDNNNNNNNKIFIDNIIQQINSSFNQINIDPILITFKSNEILHQFYHKRILEIIEENLKIFFENIEKNQINNITNEVINLKENLNNSTIKLNELTKINNELINEKNILKQNIYNLEEELNMKKK